MHVVADDGVSSFSWLSSAVVYTPLLPAHSSPCTLRLPLSWLLCITSHRLSVALSTFALASLGSFSAHLQGLLFSYSSLKTLQWLFTKFRINSKLLATDLVTWSLPKSPRSPWSPPAHCTLTTVSFQLLRWARLSCLRAFAHSAPSAPSLPGAPSHPSGVIQNTLSSERPPLATVRRRPLVSLCPPRLLSALIMKGSVLPLYFPLGRGPYFLY